MIRGGGWHETNYSHEASTCEGQDFVGGWGGGAKVPSGSVALALHLLVRNDLVNKIEFLAPLTKWTNGIGVMYIALCLQQYIIFSLSYRKKKKDT